MKMFKNLTVAAKYANEAKTHIIKVGNVYLVGDLSATTDVTLLANGYRSNHTGFHHAGTVTLKHLNRLGNANHATANPKWESPYKAFDDNGQVIIGELK